MRISKVTTKSGDRGKTSLGNGERVSKSHLIINLLGDIDELNSQIGSAISSCNSRFVSSELQSIQQDLFNLGGEISIFNSGTILISDVSVYRLCSDSIYLYMFSIGWFCRTEV